MAISQNDEGYCLLGDVQRMTGKVYDTDSVPTDLEVEEMIKERADILNGCLSARGYAVPIDVSAARSSRILRYFNAKGAAADADNGTPGQLDQNERSEAWEEQFNSFCEKMQKGILDLPDVTETGEEALPTGQQEPDSEFNLDDDGDEREKVFDRDTEW